MKPHQISILTSHPGKTWASCSTCWLTSKQGTKANAEAWMFKHQEEVLKGLHTPKKRKFPKR